ncbi:hypothetical protein Tco_1471683 [Tanacetum coccineum]
MAEQMRLQICVQFDDTWAWVAMGPERQPDAVAGAPAVAKDAPAVDEGDQAVPAPVQAPQQPPPPPLAAARTVPQRLGRLEEDVQGLLRDVRSLHGLMERSMTDQGRFSTWMIDAPGRGLVRPAPLQHSRTHNSQTHDPSYLYLLIKPDSKFSTIVHEYMEPSRIFTLKARMKKRDDFECVEAEDKSKKTSL